MVVPRGTRAPLNPVSSACNDCVSQSLIQQKILFLLLWLSARDPLYTARERTDEEHIKTNQE